MTLEVWAAFVVLETPLAILALTSVLIELGVLALYAGVSVRAGAYAGDRRTGWLQRASGGFLVAAGARLALTRST
jgi:threonine/homoserine/homoserine lactone efflux protein